MFDASSNTTPIVPKQLPNWLIGVLVLLAVVFLYFFSQVAAIFGLGIFAATQHLNATQLTNWLSNSVEVQFAYSLLADGILLVGVLLVLRWLRWTWATIGLKRPKLTHLVLGLVAVVPYYVFYLALAVVLSLLIPGLNLSQKQEIGFDSVHGSLQLTLTFLSLVVLPPLAEEITVRGLLYTGLRRWLRPITAGLIASVLFAAAHLAEGGAAGPLWIGAIDTFTLSIVLVFLREKTGNLWAGIVLHAVKNLVAFVSLFIIVR